jgi:hypothetical protein
MNKRIGQLAEQATTSIKDEYGHWIGSELDEEKFAELIVQECATVIEKNLFQGIGWNTSRAVKRHFGIGEEE